MAIKSDNYRQKERPILRTCFAYEQLILDIMSDLIYHSFDNTVSIFNHGHAKWALPCFGDKLLKLIDSQAMLYTMS